MLYKYGSVFFVVILISSLICGCMNKSNNNVNNANEYIKQAIVASNRYEFSAAKDWLEKSIKLNYKNPDAHYLLGLTYRELNYTADKVVSEFLITIQLDENYSDAYRDLGIYYGLIGKKKEAEEYLMKALKLNRNDVLTLTNIGTTYFDRKEYDKARNAYEEAVKINSDSSTLWFRYGRLYFELKDYDKAEECFKESLKRTPVQPFSYEYLAKIEKARGNQEAYLKYKEEKKVVREQYNKKLKRVD